MFAVEAVGVGLGVGVAVGVGNGVGDAAKPPPPAGGELPSPPQPLTANVAAIVHRETTLRRREICIECDPADDTSDSCWPRWLTLASKSWLLVGSVFGQPLIDTARQPICWPIQLPTGK